MVTRSPSTSGSNSSSAPSPRDKSRYRMPDSVLTSLEPSYLRAPQCRQRGVWGAQPTPQKERHRPSALVRTHRYHSAVVSRRWREDFPWQRHSACHNPPRLARVHKPRGAAGRGPRGPAQRPRRSTSASGAPRQHQRVNPPLTQCQRHVPRRRRVAQVVLGARRVGGRRPRRGRRADRHQPGGGHGEGGAAGEWRPLRGWRRASGRRPSALGGGEGAAAAQGGGAGRKRHGQSLRGASRKQA